MAPSPQHLKREKGKSREGEKRKRGSSQLVKTKEKEHALFSVPWEESSLAAEDFEPDIFGILRWTVDYETLHLFTSETHKACLRATFAGETDSPREARRLSGTSAPEGELTTVL